MVQGKIRVMRMTGSHQLKPIATGQAGRVGKESNTWVMSSAPFVARLSLRHDLFAFTIHGMEFPGSHGGDPNTHLSKLACAERERTQRWH